MIHKNAKARFYLITSPYWFQRISIGAVLALPSAIQIIKERGLLSSFYICDLLIGTHSRTYDHVYSSSQIVTVIFVECVASLIEGLFHGYNTTVLAYNPIREL